MNASMKSKIAVGAVFAVMVFLALVPAIRNQAPPAKARAQRIAGVNSVRTVSLVLAASNAPPIAQPGLRK
jgi:hypothetical protein